jgi:hypothetical protein
MNGLWFIKPKAISFFSANKRRFGSKKFKKWIKRGFVIDY